MSTMSSQPQHTGLSLDDIDVSLDIINLDDEPVLDNPQLAMEACGGFHNHHVASNKEAAVSATIATGCTHSQVATVPVQCTGKQAEQENDNVYIPTGVVEDGSVPALGTESNPYQTDESINSDSIPVSHTEPCTSNARTASAQHPIQPTDGNSGNDNNDNDDGDDDDDDLVFSSNVISRSQSNSSRSSSVHHEQNNDTIPQTVSDSESAPNPSTVEEQHSDSITKSKTSRHKRLKLSVDSALGIPRRERKLTPIAECR
jgi:hypothetical protein